MTWIVWGPPGCGKTRNRDAIVKHLGAKGFIETAEFPDKLDDLSWPLLPNWVYLVTADSPPISSDRHRNVGIVDFYSLPDAVRHSRPPLPSDWAIGIALEAAGLDNDDQNIADAKQPAGYKAISLSILAHARLIEQTQPAPVAIELQCARDACAEVWPRVRGRILEGGYDDEKESGVFAAIKAIELYKERSRERD